MGIFNRKKKNEEVDIHVLDQKMNQNIFNILQYYLPRDWQEVIFFAGYYKEDSGFFKYWVKMPGGLYLDCFTYIPEAENGEPDILQEQLMELHQEMKSVRAKLSEKDRWVCMEMSVTNQCKLSKNYDYADGVAKEDLMQYVEEYKDNLNRKYSN